MKRAVRYLAFLGLVLVFAAGILCSTLATPGRSLASAIDCSQRSGAMAMAGCENPSYLCGFGSPSDLLSQGALSSARFHELLKNALSPVVGEVPLAVLNDWAPLIDRERLSSSVVRPHKVSIRLFNSILNL